MHERGVIMSVLSKAGWFIVGGPIGLGYAFYKDSKDEEMKREAFRDGMRKSNIENQKKFAEEMERKEKAVRGAYALAVYVAGLDGYISEQEGIELDRVAGDISKEFQSEGLRNALKAIFDEKPDFKTICNRYFQNISKKGVESLNELVEEMYYAEERQANSPEERFYKYEWLPFYNEKMGISLKANNNII